MTHELIAIRPSLKAVVSLLEAVGLPSLDLTDAHLEHFFFAGSQLAPTGIVGVEIYGSCGLLRSLAVGSEHRNQRLGSLLVGHIEDYAASRGVRQMFLLTTTAEAFFAARGYRRTARDAAPPGIRTSREFSDICPASSAFMVKDLA